MDTVGPISRTVEDAAMTLGAIAGYDPKDPYTWNTPVPDYRAALDGDIKGIRVGIITELINSDQVETGVREAVVKAATVLGGLGASVEEVSVPLTRHANAIGAIPLAIEPASNQQEWVKNRLQDYGHDNRIGLLTGSIMPAQAYYKAQKLRSMLRQQVLEALEKYDVLISPTSGRVAPRLVQDDPAITGKETVGRLPFMLTNTFNLASAPAVSVPCGFGARDLPVTSDRRSSLLRGDDSKGGPRISAEYTLAHHEAIRRVSCLLFYQGKPVKRRILGPYHKFMASRPTRDRSSSD
jgi:aspartyl-tRNA(Asn)/glutamyl-tRNA(Gln) amidotransferase subunit A